MDLELKHLAPYLPYGLKVFRDTGETTDILELSAGKIQLWQDGYYEVFKPILRPLSEVWNKEYQKQDWAEYIKYDRVKELFVVDTETSSGTMHLKSFVSILDFLYSNHFDVFGLIDAGLAIDINTI